MADKQKSQKQSIAGLKSSDVRKVKMTRLKNGKGPAQETLHDSEAWYQRLLNTMNEGFSIRDENTVFTYVNDKFCEMLGYERDEIIGSKISDFTDPDTTSLFEKHMEERRKGKRDTYECTMIKKNGQKLHTILSAAPLFDDDGNFRGGFGTMTDITQLKLAEKKNIEHQQNLQSLTLELSLAEERVRRRIAGDLHDRIGQTLAMIKIKLGELGESANSPDLKKELYKVRSFVDQTINDTRSLTLELSPPILYELGFESAVEWLAEEFYDRHAIQVELVSNSRDKPLNEDVKVLLFKIVQELLFNVVKHAHTNFARLNIHREDKILQITVEDNGKGFNAKESKSLIFKKGGFGLFSIRERLNHLGGDFKIESKPDHGTCVTISVPLTSIEESTEEN